MAERMESVKSIEQLVERYPWWSGGHLAWARARGVEGVSPATRLVALLHPVAAVPFCEIKILMLSVKTEDSTF